MLLEHDASIISVDLAHGKVVKVLGYGTVFE